jgi:ribosomal protein S27E
MEKRRKGRRSAKPKKSWIQKCKDCLRQFIAFLFSNVGIICLVVGYTLAGAVMFKEIEGKNTEDNFKYELQNFYNLTLDNLWNFASLMTDSENGSNFQAVTENELKKFQNIVTRGVKNSDYDGLKIYSERWSIYAAFLYCLTVITTIGE